MNVKRGDRPDGERARSYTSPLRDEQARRTRERILDGVLATLARGVAELSVPAVAAEAGVSVPTVYRHFGSKRGLLAALPEHVNRRSGLLPETPPANLGEVARAARMVYRRYRELDPTLRAAMASELGGTMRRESIPRRLAMFREAIEASAPGLDAATIDRLARLMLLLFSSAMVRAFDDYLGRTGNAAADDVAWAVDALVAGARARATATGDGR